MTRWTPDEPGRPPRVITEPLTAEPLVELYTWGNAALGRPAEPAGNACLKCGGGPLEAWDADCAHVTREGLRERLRGEVTVKRWWSGLLERGCLAGHYPGGVEVSSVPARLHPTQEGATEAVLDALVGRAVDQLRHPLHVGEVRDGSVEWSEVGTLANWADTDASGPHRRPLELGERVRVGTDGNVGVVVGNCKSSSVQVQLDGSAFGFWYQRDLLSHLDEPSPRPFEVGDRVGLIGVDGCGRVARVAADGRAWVLWDGFSSQLVYAPQELRHIGPPCKCGDRGRGGDDATHTPERCKWSEGRRVTKVSAAEPASTEPAAPVETGDVACGCLRAGCRGCCLGTEMRLTKVPADEPAETRFEVGDVVDARAGGRAWIVRVMQVRDGRWGFRVRYSDASEEWLLPDDLRRHATPEERAEYEEGER